jgi:DegV family protein with EDD domain
MVAMESSAPGEPARTGRRIGIVTDSTSYLPAGVADKAGLAVTPMNVVVPGVAHDEDQVAPEHISEALRAWEVVTTAGPNPERLLMAYRTLAAQGAEEIVSIHISSHMSGTVSSAQIAASRSPVPTHVIDSRTVGMALGFSALAAVRAVNNGRDVESVIDIARRTAEASRQYFYVDTLEHLRRGGRINVGQALIGQALSVKPLLTVLDGKVEPAERVRTSARALARLEDLAVASAVAMQAVSIDVAVHHLDSAARADVLAERMQERLGPRLAAAPVVTEIGAAVGAHVGPGMVAVVVSPHLLS